MSQFKEVHTQCLECSRDSLMVNIGIVCQALDNALPFTDDKLELCKMYILIDEHLKSINQAIDIANGITETNEELDNA